MLDVLNIALRFFEAPFSFFDELLRHSGMWGFYFSILAMYMAYRFLIVPILGASQDALSDKAVNRARQTWNKFKPGK